MARKEYVVDEVQKLMDNKKNVRNIAIVAHVDHGKTTLTDSLVARAGLLNKKLAGQQRVMDFDEQEQARGITIKSAYISLGFPFEGKDYLINLIDTPGHVDFGGHVTRAMRAVDGVVVVVDAVEGIMPQTETVLRQAMKEKAQPTVFVNKVDRLIKELQLTPEEMQEKLIKVITGVNKLVEEYAPKENKKEWKIAVEKGNIAFGSAYLRWAVSIESMKRSNISFKDIVEHCSSGNDEILVKKSPIDEVLLEMTVKHLPNPSHAQKYRIPTIWHGDIETEEGKAMINCDPNGPMVGVVFGVANDKHAGEVAIVRLFSGKVTKSSNVFLASKKKMANAQHVGIYMGKDRVPCDEINAGNIGAIVGLKDVYVGETVSSKEIYPFEKIKHYSEPVVTKSIEAKNSKDLAKLISTLRELTKEDPTLKVELNHETGEHLISGMGELHLEIVEHNINVEKGIPIQTSPPIVVYREKINQKFDPLEGRSPNKHTRLIIQVEPIEDEIMKALEEGEITDGKAKGKASIKEYIDGGVPRDDAKRVVYVHNKNILIDNTRGVQYLNEIMELVTQGFKEAMDKSPLAREKAVGVKVRLLDATIHEDAVHRGPAQILPATRNPIYAGMLKAGITLQEPKIKILIQVPHEYANDVITMTQGKRGRLIDMEQEGKLSTIKIKMPVAEMFGFSNELRGTTQGRAIWYQEYAGYEGIPKSLQPKIVRKIRERKRLEPEPRSANDFLS